MTHVSRLAVDKLQPGELTLTGEAAHYLRNVVRARRGQELVLFDGRGLQAQARVVTVERGQVTVMLTAPEAVASPACALTIGVAPPKGERADWLVEKLTEVGVSGIVWLACEHGRSTGRKPPERHERWERIARAAASQAGCAQIPVLDGPVPLEEFVSRECDSRYIGSSDGQPLPHVVRDGAPATAVLAVGPEGGFSDGERQTAERAGCRSVRLGLYTLRVETAAVVGAAMILAAGGDIS